MGSAQLQHLQRFVDNCLFWHFLSSIFHSFASLVRCGIDVIRKNFTVYFDNIYFQNQTVVAVKPSSNLSSSMKHQRRREQLPSSLRSNRTPSIQNGHLWINNGNQLQEQSSRQQQSPESFPAFRVLVALLINVVSSIWDHFSTVVSCSRTSFFQHSKLNLISRSNCVFPFKSHSTEN